MANAIDIFNETMNEYSAAIDAAKFKNNELSLSNKANLGMYKLVFIPDVNIKPFRMVKNCYHFFVNNGDYAKEYGLKSRDLKICNVSEYSNLTNEGKQVISTLWKMLDKIKKGWDNGWSILGKYAPNYIKTMTCMYAKVLSFTPEGKSAPSADFTSEVKLLTCTSGDFAVAFKSFVETQKIALESQDFLNDMFPVNGELTRNTQYILKVAKPEKRYTYMFSSVPKPITLTEDEINSVGNLNEQVINLESPDLDEYKKWIEMFKGVWNAIDSGETSDSARENNAYKKMQEQVETTKQASFSYTPDEPAYEEPEPERDLASDVFGF